MPIDHTSLPVSSLPASTAFYTEILKPLKYKVYMSLPNVVGFVAPRAGPDFWITGSEKKKEEVEEGVKIPQVHVAFKGNSKSVVNEWHANALKAGATCNGPPGERLQYHKGYYAAYILDPDGHNIEVIYFQCWWITALQIAPGVLAAAAVAGLGWWAGRKGWGV